MPIYEYACKNCQHVLDVLQKIADEPLVVCPECSEPQLKRLLSAPHFRLKGKGWYETDFKKDNQRNLAGDTKPAKESDKVESGKSDKAGSGKDDRAGSGKDDKAAAGKGDKESSAKSKSPKPESDSNATAA